jgi:hypothetical protein
MRVDNFIEVKAESFKSPQGYEVQAWKFDGTTRCMSEWFLDIEKTGVLQFINDSNSVEPGYYQLRDRTKYHRIDIGSWITYIKEFNHIGYCNDEVFKNTYINV